MRCFLNSRPLLAPLVRKRSLSFHTLMSTPKQSDWSPDKSGSWSFFSRSVRSKAKAKFGSYHSRRSAPIFWEKKHLPRLILFYSRMLFAHHPYKAGLLHGTPENTHNPNNERPDIKEQKRFHASKRQQCKRYQSVT